MKLFYKHTPTARRQGWLVAQDTGLHAGGEEQGADRHPRFQPGGHLQGRMDPVGELTCPHERGRENDLASLQAMGGGRSEQPQQGVHGVACV